MLLEYQDLRLRVDEGVYKPSDDSYLLVENLKVKIGDIVLEIGTGCGLVSLIAAKTANKIVATDISPIAIECARYNVELNQLITKVEIRQGNLFDPIKSGEKFDLIIFNPPYLPENNKLKHNQSSWLEKAWDGGKSGRELIDPFIRKCKFFLNPAGRVQLVQSSLSNISKSYDLFQEQGFQVKISTSKSFFFEKIVLIDAFQEKQ